MGVCPSCLEPLPQGAARCAKHNLREDPLVGTLLAGSYRIDRMLGQGGMGRVYAGTDVRLERPVAIKVLLPQADGDDTATERFQREARAVAALAHQNIVTIYDVGDLGEGRSYLVMEFLDGLSIQHQLAARGAFDPAGVASVIGQIARALGAAHDQGLIHRDLKPENVLLVERDGQDDFVKVLDFGLAKKFGDGSGSEEALTQSGFAMGTPAYMSPEQIVGPAVDHRADVYALAMLAYAMICGRPAFEGATSQEIMISQVRDDPPAPSTLRPGLSPALDAVLLRSLAKKPARRHDSVTDLAEEIAAALEDASEQPAPLAPAKEVATAVMPSVSMLPGQQGPQSTLSAAAAESLSVAKPAGANQGFPRWIAIAAAILLVGGVAAALLLGGSKPPPAGIVRPASPVAPAAPVAAVTPAPAQPVAAVAEPDAGVEEAEAGKALRKAPPKKAKAKARPRRKRKAPAPAPAPAKDDALKIDLDL